MGELDFLRVVYERTSHIHDRCYTMAHQCRKVTMAKNVYFPPLHPKVCPELRTAKAGPEIRKFTPPRRVRKFGHSDIQTLSHSDISTP